MTSLFTQYPTSVVLDVTYIVWWMSEFFGAFVIPRLRDRSRTSVRRDRGSAMVIIFSVWISVLVALGLGYTGTTSLPDLAFYLGISLMLLGIVVRQYAIAILGRFFSLAVRITEDHKVVDRGPYRYVRHPSYTGALLTFIGLGLSVQSWAAIIVLLLMFAVAYGYRMSVEENTLKSQLGQDYVSYMQRTKRLIPFLL